jgi:hypothetical protein
MSCLSAFLGVVEHKLYNIQPELHHIIVTSYSPKPIYRSTWRAPTHESSGGAGSPSMSTNPNFTAALPIKFDAPVFLQVRSNVAHLLPQTN